MAELHRRVGADSASHAAALADNLARDGYVVVRRDPDEWVLRKHRRRGDHWLTVTIHNPVRAEPLLPSTWVRAPWGPPELPAHPPTSQ